jgi:hypothetical protein
MFNKVIDLHILHEKETIFKFLKFILISDLIMESWDSTVSMATGYGVDDQGVGV